MGGQENLDPIKTFLAGAAIGAGAALLFAPRTGEQTREKLRQWSEQARNSVETGGRDLISRIRSLREDIENLSSITIETGQERVRSEMEALLTALEEGRRVLQQERQRRSEGISSSEDVPSEIGSEEG